jgi:ketosteroid isomerase-like protein
MSQDNVEILQSLFAAINRGDLDAALKDAAPEFELDWTRADGPQRGAYRLDQMRAFLVDFLETFESTRVEPDEFIEAGEQVVVPQTGYQRGRDGIEVTARIALVWTFRDGAIVRCCLYRNKQEALEAVGLRE